MRALSLYDARKKKATAEIRPAAGICRPPAAESGPKEKQAAGGSENFTKNESIRNIT